MKTKDRFLRKIKKEGSCWTWKARKSKDGYGQFWFRGRIEGAHRAAYVIFIGEIGEAHVLHSCDNRDCVNPEHLFLSSNFGNVRDAIEKGRRNDEGENNNNSKLTKKDVLYIRSSKESRGELAELFDVTKATIGHIQRRNTWKHV